MTGDPITADELQRALLAGEFDVVYQPEVDLRTGHIVAVEALVRWHRPGQRTILPSEFIPVAERNGAISGLTKFVLERSLEQAAKWSTARWDGDPVPVWVNLSAKDLADPRLPTRVNEALAYAGVRPSQLGLELTETAPIDEHDLAICSLRRLHAAGVRIALDDFGTGYSSLAHLRTLPVDVIKIDRSFVERVMHSSPETVIVTGMIEMAHALRRVVVAEGIEDSTQQQALEQLGCDLGQGYLFASPQPAHCVDILLAADRELASSSAPVRNPPVRIPQPRGLFADPSWATPK